MLLQTGEKSRGGHPITPKRFQKRSIPKKKTFYSPPPGLLSNKSNGLARFLAKGCTLPCLIFKSSLLCRLTFANVRLVLVPPSSCLVSPGRLFLFDPELSDRCPPSLPLPCIRIRKSHKVWIDR